MTASQFLVIGILPLILVGLLTLPLIRVGLNLADEGYLVHGTLEVLKGKVPIRDFRAYDPGRYYYCALWTYILGGRFVPVRWAMALVMVAALSLCGWVVLIGTGSVWVAGLCCCLSFVWMQPRHKQLEVFFSILCIAVLSWVMLDGSALSWVILGAAMGIGAFFGLNIFVYFVGAGLLAGTVYVLIATPVFSGQAVVAFLAGLGAGLLPAGYLVIRYPGFAKAYFDRKIVPIFRRRSTNLPLPKPWLWSRSGNTTRNRKVIKGWALKFIFTSVPILCGGIVVFSGYVKTIGEFWQVTVAAACVGLVYFHHVMSRAGWGHLYQAVHPSIIALATLAATAFGETTAVGFLLGLLAFSIPLVWTGAEYPFGYLARKRFKTLATPFEMLRVEPRQAELLEVTGLEIEKLTDPGEPIFAAPVMPGFYPFFDRAPASFDTFSVYPASNAAQQAMLEDLILSKPRIAIIDNIDLDQREDLRFLRNYDRVASHLADCFTETGRHGTLIIFARTDENIGSGPGLGSENYD